MCRGEDGLESVLGASLDAGDGAAVRGEEEAVDPGFEEEVKVLALAHD